MADETTTINPVTTTVDPDLLLNILNEDCIGCTSTDTEGCDTTTFSADAPPVAKAEVIVSGLTDYSVCCDPIAIDPVTISLCTRGVVFFQHLEIVTVPTNGKLFLANEELAVGDEISEQENGLIVYKRTIAETEDGVQPASTDTFSLKAITTGGESAPLVYDIVLEEATCITPSPCSSPCGC